MGAIIGTDGAVKELHIVSGQQALQRAALDPVNTWRYQPYLLNNQPVEVTTQINVVFTLSSH